MNYLINVKGGILTAGTQESIYIGVFIFVFGGVHIYVCVFDNAPKSTKSSSTWETTSLKHTIRPGI